MDLRFLKITNKVGIVFTIMHKLYNALDNVLQFNPVFCNIATLIDTLLEQMGNDILESPDRKSFQLLTFGFCLGVIISQGLTWNVHVDYILKKANMPLQKKASLNPQDHVHIDCSFLLSCVKYASCVWSDSSDYL